MANNVGPFRRRFSPAELETEGEAAIFNILLSHWIRLNCVSQKSFVP